MLMRIKNILRSFGWDIRRHHSLYDTALKHYHINTIIDIGANDGLWSKEMRSLLPTAQIYAFEPLKDCYDRLTKRFEGDQHFKAFNVALGEKDGTADLGRSSFHPSSSMRAMAPLHKELYPKSAAVTHEEVLVRRLDSIEGLDLAPGILIKMDVQGFEDKVIAGGQKTLDKARVIIIETAFVTLYEGQPLFGDIHDQLRRLGFSYHGNCGEHYSSKTGERIYEDSVFVKD